MLHALIMAGGGGTRFWPRSRQRRPKQFLTLAGDRSLLQQACDRLEALVPAERTWIITGAPYTDETRRQLPHLPSDRVIGEPCGRDTAACIGLGAALIAATDPEAIMLVTPADHVIEPTQEFGRAVHVAELMVLEYPNALVTFGVKPTFLATGYGYIQIGDEIGNRQGVSVFRVQAFREKPTVELAAMFIDLGGFFWNSGIFVWKAATILEALRVNQTRLHAAIERITAGRQTPQREEIFRREYEALDKISIDYAVMEKASEVLVVQAPFRWDDVGSWLAVERMNPQDADGNTVLASHAGINTKGCVIAGDRDRLIATIGAKDLIIIQDGDAVLIADRNDEGAVKQLVEELKKRDLERFL